MLDLEVTFISGIVAMAHVVQIELAPVILMRHYQICFLSAPSVALGIIALACQKLSSKAS
jgi:hypothetical protein